MSHLLRYCWRLLQLELNAFFVGAFRVWLMTFSHHIEINKGSSMYMFLVFPDVLNCIIAYFLPEIYSLFVDCLLAIRHFSSMFFCYAAAHR